MTDPIKIDVAIIGAGMAGIGAAIKLKEQGIDFVVLEKASEVGGVWRENTYPGCACDVPSALYSYSFSLKPDWNNLFAKQAQIQEYLVETVDQYQLRDKVHFDSEVQRIERVGEYWRVATAEQVYLARYVVVSTGPMHHPVTPCIAGIDDFNGEQFHSAQWRHDIDLTGKRVAVIGSGASAIQFVPQIQKHAAAVAVFQRTPPWVLPKFDRPLSDRVKKLFKKLPVLQRMFRWVLFKQFESLTKRLMKPDTRKPLQQLALRNLYKGVKDKALRKKLTPNYEIGCKRILQSNDWYPALAQENVEVFGGVSAVDGQALVDAAGERFDADVLIYATGFDVAVPEIGNHIIADGVPLAERWAGKPSAYLGTLTHSCPNLFFTFGPNLYTYSSAFVIVEAQLKFIVKQIKRSKASGKPVAVTEKVEARYNKKLQHDLKSSVFNSGCNSYFLNNGYNSTTWPYTVVQLDKALAASIHKI